MPFAQRQHESATDSRHHFWSQSKHSNIGKNCISGDEKMKRTIVAASVLGLVLLMTACSSNDAAPKKTIARTDTQQSAFTPTDLETTVNSMVAAINKANPTSMRLDMILKQASAYFQPIVVGANRAMSELQVTGSTTAPGTTDADAATAGENTMLADAVAQGSKGIGIAPMDVRNVPDIDAAVEAGVPVVTLDSDQADSKRALYIGTLNGAAGTTAGNTLKQFLPSGPGTVVLLGQGTADWPDGYNRTMGAKKVLDDAGYTTAVVTAVWSDSGASDLAALGNLIATSDPPVVGMIGMFSNAYECAQAVEAAGKTASDIAVVAFDFDTKTVGYMQSGLIKATHAQRQYYMGYLTPYVLYGINILGEAKTKEILAAQMIDEFQFNTGLDVVPHDQYAEYQNFLDGLGIGSSN